MGLKRTPVNYLYFGALFVFLLVLIAGSIFTKAHLGNSAIFFVLYAVGQALLEVTLFAFFGILVRQYLGKVVFALFIGGTFFVMFIHLFDFMMDRVLDLSAWEAFKIFVLEENWSQFLLLLDASGISLWAWLLFFATLAALPWLGILLYRITNTVVQKRPLMLRQAHFLQVFFCTFAALFLWDFSASRTISPDVYTAFIKSLPWKLTFLKPQTVSLSMPGALTPLPTDESMEQAIAHEKSSIKKKPNIYLFIIESLREDAITADIAPHLHAFKQQQTHYDLALSNGNATHISWFSIFHSQYPYAFRQVKEQSTKGSFALQLLKKWGYNIRLYTSAELAYYGMGELLFGKEYSLLDAHRTFHLPPPAQAADSDTEGLKALQADLLDPKLQQGQLCIVFWDGTHFAYSWPKTWAPKFSPFAKEFAYFQTFHSEKTLGKLKNRYYNAIHYMDSLFGQFLQTLPNREEAVIIVTGDHGEEFFEHGHLFHNSHLVQEQMHIPLYFQFPGKKAAPRSVISQMDIFPSLIDFLSDREPQFLKGRSLFRTVENPFAITARFNAGLTPYEFSIHNGQTKLVGQFLNRKQIFKADEIQILSLQNKEGRSLGAMSDFSTFLHQEFGFAFHQLFESSLGTFEQPVQK